MHFLTNITITPLGLNYKIINMVTSIDDKSEFEEYVGNSEYDYEIFEGKKKAWNEYRDSFGCGNIEYEETNEFEDMF